MSFRFASRAAVCAALLGLCAPLVSCTAATSTTQDVVVGDAGVSPAAGTEVVEGTCVVDASSTASVPDFLGDVACTADLLALASTPIDSPLPGARSVKVILDGADGSLSFQNSARFLIHYEFASTHLSGGALPLVADLATFNATEYFSPERRFVLGAVSVYARSDGSTFALEVSPYDTASAAQITALFTAVKAHGFFGPALRFHPTSESVAVEAAKLVDVPLVTTDELYAGIDYQPLSLATAVGHLRFLTAEELEDTYVSPEDLVVLDQAPNDISVVQGIITEQFQTPLSHLNVLSQNRHAPNMGLRNAKSDPTLIALQGKLVELTVGPSSYSVHEATLEEAEASWLAKRPTAVVLPALDLDVTDLRDAETVTSLPTAGSTSLREAIANAVRAFGGKAAHYSVLAQTAGIPVKKAFAISVFYYQQFMVANGFADRIAALLVDDSFNADSGVREAALASLRSDMEAAPLDETFVLALRTKMETDYPGRKLRFRSSTNSEDLDGFPCAGCYESHTGDPADWEDVEDAVRETWASAWLFRTFEERSYYGVAHDSVGMALLVHTNFEDEEANGVAVTNNVFDESGLSPAFYVNVQQGGDAEVVHPPAGVSSDQFVHYFYQPNQPLTYVSHSSLVPAGTTVLTAAQVHSLGTALDLIHRTFAAAYGPAAGNDGWYAMDVELKFDDEEAPGEVPRLFIKQARPYPGRGDE